MGQIFLQAAVLAIIGYHIPHVKEHGGHIPDCLAFQHDSCIFPVAEALLLVNVLICQVHPACKSHVTVNDTEFPVVTVVLDNVQDRTERIEHLTLDALRPHGFIIFMRKCGKTAHVIIDQTDVQPFLNFLLQNIQNGSPHDPIMDNKIFNKNVMLRLLQFLHKNREHIVSHLEIFRCGVSMGRIAGIPIYIVRLIAGRGIFHS